MNKFNQVITEYRGLLNFQKSCDVKYIRLRDIFQKLKGTSITATKMKEIESPDGEIRIFAGGKTVVNAREGDIPNANVIRVPAVLVQSRGVIDVIYCDQPFTFKSEMWAYTCQDPITVRYLYYALKVRLNELRAIAESMGSLPQISAKVTDCLQIPLPPIEVQQYIVSILDMFSQLAAELAAELAARKKQYAHYRETLLNFQESCDVKYVRLGDVCEILDNQRRPIAKEHRQPGEYPYYGANGIQDHISDYIFNGTYILVGEDGSVITSNGNPVVNWASGKIWVNNHAHVLAEKPGVLLRYLFYCLQVSDITSLIHGNIPKLTNSDLKNLQVPIPPLPVQKRIVYFLDNFEAVCNSLQIGLPAEIEARRKQYEYYRDILLSFNPANTHTHGEWVLICWIYGIAELVKLGDVIQENRKRNKARLPLTPMTVSNSLGLVPTAEYFDRQRTSEDTSGYKVLEPGDFAYNPARINIGSIAWNQGDKSVIVSPMYASFSVDQGRLLNAYLTHYLKTAKAARQIENRVEQGARFRFPLEYFKDIVIPLPPVKVQQYIVSILDHFEQLCGDLTGALPREIEAVQKQYEYYRDRLLSFGK